MGHALTANIYLDIPPLLSGLRESFDQDGAPDAEKMIMSEEMWKFLRESPPDPKDPTSIVAEYFNPWWTRATEWKEVGHALLDSDAAFSFHCTKVSSAPLPPVPY